MSNRTLFDPDVTRTAVISPDGLYRYQLARHWNANGPVAGFIMLNPSTADAAVDDPTIRRCVAFAKSWGCGGLVVVNLFALRATDPEALRGHPEPVGPDNNWHIREVLAGRSPIVAAWGALGGHQGRDAAVLRLLRVVGDKVQCLGKTKDGRPRHPLYLRSDAALVPLDTPAPPGVP